VSDDAPPIERWLGELGLEIVGSSADPSASNQGFGMMTFLGGAWWTSEKPYNKLALDDFAEEPVKEAVTGGWAAMIQHYFVSAWIPAKDSANHACHVAPFTRAKHNSRAHNQQLTAFFCSLPSEMNLLGGEF